MSRSYRRPYANFCGIDSAKPDRIIASRAVRRAHRQAVHQYLVDRDWDESLVLPQVYECAHNDVWGWNRDGHFRYMPEPLESDYQLYGCPDLDTFEWLLNYWIRIQRK